MPISQKLCELRDKRNLTNQQIADLSGVPVTSVNRILSGQTENPTFANVSDITRALGGSLDELGGLLQGKGREMSPEERIIAIYASTIRDKNRWIMALFILLGALLIGIIALFAYDFTYLDRGWYIQEAMNRVKETGASGAIDGFLSAVRRWLSL